MSKKKKRRSGRSGHTPSSPYNRSEGSVLADEQEQNQKKLDPTARNLLLTDLVILALAGLGDRLSLLSPVVSTGITILGFILILVAMWYQFGGGGRNRGGGLGG